MERIKFNYQFSLFLILIAATSICVTGGKTIFLLSPILLYFLFDKTTSWRINVLDTIVLPICFILACVVLYDLKYFTDGYLNLEPNGDKSFFAQVSAYIKHTGVESYYYDYSLNANRSPIAYHYGENWVTIFFSSIFNVKEYIAQELIGVPFMLGFGAYFIFKTARLFGNTIVVSLFIVIITLFFANVPFIGSLFPSKLTDSIGVFNTNFCDIPKYGFSFLCISAIIYSMALDEWQVRKETIAIATFAFMGCVSFVSICYVLLLIQTVQLRKIDLKSTLIIGVFSVYFIYFYFFLAKTNTATSYNTFDTSIFGHCINSARYIKTLINIIGLSTIQITISLLPFLLLIALVYKKVKATNLKWCIYIMCLCVFFGLLFWAVFWYSVGSVALFLDGTYVFLKVICTVVFMSTALLYFKDKPIIKGVIMTVLFICTLPAIYKTVVLNTIPKTSFANDTKNVFKINNNHPFLYFYHYNTSATQSGVILLLPASQVNSLNTIAPLHCGIFVNSNLIPRSADCLTYSRESASLNVSVFDVFKAKNSAKANDSLLINTFAKTNGIKYIIADANFKLTQQNQGLYKYFNYKLIGTAKPYLIYAIDN